MPRAASKSVAKAVNIRMADDTRSLIDLAARAQGRSRSEFMVAASRRAAQEALDQTVFVLEPEEFEAFIRRLDEPPAPNETLKRMMRTPPPWASE